VLPEGGVGATVWSAISEPGIEEIELGNEHVLALQEALQERHGTHVDPEITRRVDPRSGRTSSRH
jgi:hypothetical protein